MNYSMSENKITKTFRLGRGILKCIDIIIKVLAQRGINANKTKVLELAVMYYYQSLPLEERTPFEEEKR